MTKNILILILLITVTVAWTYWQNSLSNPLSFSKDIQPVNNNIEVIDNIYFNLLSGKSVELYEIENKTIIIHFWATWCAPCIVEFPEIIKLAEQAEREIMVIAVSVDADKQNIDQFLKKISKDVPDNFLIALDPNKAISQDIFKTIRLPESFILTPDYVIHEKIIGASDIWNEPETIERLKALQNISG